MRSLQEILPGVLEQDFQLIERKIERVKPFAKAIHIDLLDGKFAPNTTFFDPKPFAKYTQNIFFELHMMVDNPLQYIDAFAHVGFRRFIGHIEMMPDQASFVAKAQEAGEAVLALDAGTDINDIDVPFIDLDAILVMTVKAGFSNQSFLPKQLKKVKALREKTEIPLEVDGGINGETIHEAAMAGATRFVSTKHIYSNEDPKRAYEELIEKASVIVV